MLLGFYGIKCSENTENSITHTSKEKLEKKLRSIVF